MKIQAYKVDAFMKAPPANLAGVLFYGPDAGQVSEKAKIMAQQMVVDLDDPFLTALLDGEDVKEDPAKVQDELSAMAFGGGRRLLKIRDAGNAHAKTLTDAVETIPQGREADYAFLIVTAGELDTKSKLRALFEKDARLAALPCYTDDSRDLSQIVRTECQTVGILPERGVVEYLSAECQGDRLIAKNAVRKLALYVGGGQVTLEQAMACIRPVTEAQLDTISHALLAGNGAAVQEQVRRALLQGLQPVQMVRACLRATERLMLITAGMRAGQSFDLAIKPLWPPVFYKDKPLVQAQANRYQRAPKRLQALHKALFEAEIQLKSTLLPPELTLNHALLVAVWGLMPKR